jgi:hypothetical protein
VNPRSDQPNTRKSRSRSKAQSVDPATQRAPNAEEASPETLVPDVVRTTLTRETGASDVDRHRWITERAYELAAERGFAPGAELDDWLQAEREFDSKITQARPEDQFTG